VQDVPFGRCTHPGSCVQWRRGRACPLPLEPAPALLGGRAAFSHSPAARLHVVPILLRKANRELAFAEWGIVGATLPHLPLARQVSKHKTSAGTSPIWATKKSPIWGMRSGPPRRYNPIIIKPGALNLSLFPSTERPGFSLAGSTPGGPVRWKPRYRVRGPGEEEEPEKLYTLFHEREH